MDVRDELKRNLDLLIAIREAVKHTGASDPANASLFKAETVALGEVNRSAKAYMEIVEAQQKAIANPGQATGALRRVFEPGDF